MLQLYYDGTNYVTTFYDIGMTYESEVFYENEKSEINNYGKRRIVKRH